MNSFSELPLAEINFSPTDENYLLTLSQGYLTYYLTLLINNEPNDLERYGQFLPPVQ